jgi:hypothetical protein
MNKIKELNNFFIPCNFNDENTNLHFLDTIYYKCNSKHIIIIEKLGHYILNVKAILNFYLCKIYE